MCALVCVCLTLLLSNLNTRHFLLFKPSLLVCLPSASALGGFLFLCRSLEDGENGRGQNVLPQRCRPNDNMDQAGGTRRFLCRCRRSAASSRCACCNSTAVREVFRSRNIPRRYGLFLEGIINNNGGGTSLTRPPFGTPFVLLFRPQAGEPGERRKA